MYAKEPRTEREFARYFALRWQVLRAPWNQPPGSERDEYESGAFHIMVEDNSGNTIGVGRLHRKTTSLAQVRYMAIAEAWRNQGIGTLILQQLEQQAHHWSIAKVVLNARTDVVEFYRRRGYQVSGKGETLFGSIAHVTMEKVLSARSSTSD
ncbi:MAG: hypothetical protein AMJ69_01105 [Gammaproteobacteria bacterium SG8_47]|nr:MAG: hypothetical protein AMJ69_01105 [Gammaproteobacteria bacterium SG8_47]